MRKFFIVLLTLITLTGCGKDIKNDSEEVPLNMPDIVFMERVYNDNDGFIQITFTDSNGNCYTSDDKEVCNLGVEKLIDKYTSGSLQDKIMKYNSRNPEEVQINYEKLCNAISQNDCNIVNPEMLPDVESDSYSWYGLYYDENQEVRLQVIHKDECATDLYSDCDAINEIYKWYTDSYVADSKVSLSMKIPDIVFLEHAYNVYNYDGCIQIEFTDSNGNCYTSDDKEVCNLSIKELIEEYKSGNLDGRVKRIKSYNPEAVQINYKKLCNAISQNDCNIVYPDTLPDVLSNSYSCYGVYYDANEEVRLQVIQKSECTEGLYSDCEDLNEIYEWYEKNYVPVDN
ncbi:MAG: hypothetical protein K2K02_02720 [Ruminococcus sp.]|nr:hypothetical protein [Ruminococcus sp.]